MRTNLTPPPGLRGDEKSQLVQMHSFLFQLTEQLNAALSQADDRLQAAERITGLNAENENGGIPNEIADQYQNLKSLIIKTAHTVRMEMDMLVTELGQTYVAQSEFGTYKEQISREIVDTAEKTVESYGYESRLDNLDRQAADFDDYIIEASGSITRGIVDYDANGVPIIGIAIGQDLKSVKVTIDGVEYEEIDTTKNLATYTATGITFWQNGAKVAWFENSRLTCTSINVNDRVQMGGKWEISHVNGFTVKWIGGGA